jgi:hypothetical protein
LFCSAWLHFGRQQGIYSENGESGGDSDAHEESVGGAALALSCLGLLVRFLQPCITAEDIKGIYSENGENVETGEEVIRGKPPGTVPDGFLTVSPQFS